MDGSHSKRPAASGKANGSRIERSGDRLDPSNSATGAIKQARRLVDNLVSNGADLRFRASAGDLLPSFTYELRPGGDRDRCRSLVAEAKADAMLWGAVLKEVAARSGAPDGVAR